MKKLLFIVSVLALTSCGGNETEETTVDSVVVDSVVVDSVVLGSPVDTVVTTDGTKESVVEVK